MILFLIFSLFWLVIVLNKTLYYLYLWQVKGYRFDRILAQLQEPHGLGVIFTKNFYIKFLFFVLASLFEQSSLVFLGVFIFLYTAEALIIFYRALRKQIKFPLFTKKIIALFLLNVSSALTLQMLIPYGYVAASLLLIDLLIPIIVSFWVLVFKPLSFLAKQRFVAAAVTKRAGMKDLIAIGITGSFGKTSTKECLAKILSEKFLVAKTSAHENTEIGAARAILSMPLDTQILIAEEAAYRSGDIKEISSVVKPRIGIITGIGFQHLALFGSQQAIIDTKFELAQSLPEDGVLILNWDNEFIKLKIKSEKLNVKIKSYSVKDSKTDLFASQIDETLEGSFFTIHHGGESIRAETILLGRHNISNLLAASATALEVGMSLDEIAIAIARIKAFERTLAPRKGINNSFIIDDTYNASFEGVICALDVLSLAKGKKILVFTSLIELGEKAKELHAIIGRKIKDIVDIAIIVDEKYRKELKSEKTIFITDPVRVIEKVKHEVSTESVVLLEWRIPQSIIDALR